MITTSLKPDIARTLNNSRRKKNRRKHRIEKKKKIPATKVHADEKNGVTLKKEKKIYIYIKLIRN